MTTLKIAVLAPMPSDSVSTATAVNAGLFRSIRAPKTKSCQSVPTRHLPEHRPMLRGMFVASRMTMEMADWLWVSLIRVSEG